MFVILELLESKVNQFQLISTSSRGKGTCDEVQLTYVLVDWTIIYIDYLLNSSSLTDLNLLSYPPYIKL